MEHYDDKSTNDARQIIADEITAINENPTIIRSNGCAACHVLFALRDKMNLSEQDAADLLSEALLEDSMLDNQFIETIERIHMRARLAGTGFVIKTREAKDRHIESQFKNNIEELLADSAKFGTDMALRKLIISYASLQIAQNLGIDYHAATEELYHYMRKHENEASKGLTQLVRSILERSNMKK
jgi:hypothetical protein